MPIASASCNNDVGPESRTSLTKYHSVIFASVYRLYLLTTFDPNDFTYTFSQIAIWSEIE